MVLLSEIKYTKTHEWIVITDEPNWVATMGIAERVQLVHGDIVFIELAEVGDEFEAEEIIGQLNVVSGETIPIHMPVTGEVLEINELIEELQKRGFDQFLVIKKYKKFAGNAPRFLPREFFEPNTGSSRTSVLAIRENSLVDEITSDQEMANDVNVIVSTPGPSVPYGVALLNSVYRRVIASKKRYAAV